MDRNEPNRTTVLAAQAALAILVLTAWEAGSAFRLLDPFFFSRPTDVARRIVTWVATGSLWRHLFITLEESLLGLLVGAALGIGLGFALARSPFAARVLD